MATSPSTSRSFRPGRLPATAGLAALLVASVPVLSPARAAYGETPTSEGSSTAGTATVVKDAANDVRLFRRVPGLTRAQRRSVDLRSVRVDVRDDETRFTVRLRAVPRTREFDQAVFLELAPPTGSPDAWSAEVAMSPQKAAWSYAALHLGNGTDHESCDPLRAKVLRRSHRVRLDVPSRCLPEGEVAVSVTAMTAYFRSDGRIWSRDRLVFPAPVVVR